jgi:hypothetical protein
MGNERRADYAVLFLTPPMVTLPVADILHQTTPRLASRSILPRLLPIRPIASRRVTR